MSLIMLLNKIVRSNFMIRLLSWEYWPFGIIQFPVIFYWLWLSMRSRSLVFFSASNPGITMGGMFGESKYEIIKKIPDQYIPKTCLVNTPSTVEVVAKLIESNGFDWPVIFKPELGERGFMVKKISSFEEIEPYLNEIKVNFLIQEFVDLPLEFGVFYTRIPNQQNGKVTSVVMKEMLSVVGDGSSSLAQLILKIDRAKLQWNGLKEFYSERLDEIVPKGIRIELVSIGNHCLGTKFLNGNHLINDKLSMTFDSISKQIEGFYFGRFDLRCSCIEDLYEGKIKIMELNGCGAEPAHIYHPGYSVFKAIGVLLKHWQNIFEIAQENHRRGVTYASLKHAAQHYKKFKTATR
jgi:hypothetical protein